MRWCFRRRSREAGYEVLPKSEARQLVEYLRSLKTSFDLPEAPLKKSDAPEPAAAVATTNAPAAPAAK